jgi:hypothetical protein
VRYVWLAIIAVSGAPLVYVGWLANPLVIILLGPELWRDRVARLYPYRWLTLFLIIVCAFSVGTFVAKYG